MAELNRREFVKLCAVAGMGLVVGIPVNGRTADKPSELHPLIKVGQDGQITLYAQNPEMGQGVKTALQIGRAHV